MAASKVVKLEDVASLEGGSKFDRDGSHILSTGIESETAQSRRLSRGRSSTLKSAISEESSGTSSKSKSSSSLAPTTAESLQGEATDLLYPLPKDWPRLPQVSEQKGFTKAWSTSVNKACSHLELLQNIIDEWFDAQLASRTSTRAASGLLSLRGEISSLDRKQLRFSALSHASQATLRVDGIGGKADAEAKSKERDAIAELDIPYLGAEEVLDEVMTLLGILETDRQDARILYKEQKRLVESLGSKIDNIAAHRMNELPKAVQKEHEACSRDIYELQWHVSYRGRAEERIRTKMEIASALNIKLTEDIAFVNKHCPLVQGKLDLERNAMERIHAAQTETAEELNVTLERCARVEKKSADAHAKADAERQKMKKQLETVNAELQRTCKALADAKSLHESYVHRIFSTRDKLQNNEQEITVLEVKNENAKTAESMQSAKVRDLEIKIDLQEKEHERLMDDNLQKRSDIVIKKKNFQKREDELQKKVYKLEDEHQFVSRVAAENEMDIDDMRRKIEDCAKQRIADEKNIQRIKKEMEKTDELMKVTMDEFIKVEAVNNAIREKLRSEEEQALASEDALKVTAEALKKQVKDEIHARTVLQARIQSDGQELVKAKAESKGKNEKVKKVASEIEEAVRIVEAKVEKLRAIHAEKSAMVNDLQENISDVKNNHEEAETTYNARLAELQPLAAHLKDDIVSLEKKLDHIEWRSEMMQKKMDDMGASASMMQRLTDTTEKAIKQLTDEVEELTIQFDAGQRLEDELKSSLSEVTSRTRDYDHNHKNYMQARKEVLRQHEVSLEENKALNQELASRYRKLQNQYIILKDKLLNQFEERIQLENNVKDLKQLQSLQQRLHFALAEYYKYRGMFNKGELSRLGTEAYINGEKLEQLQTQMNKALESMSEFLIKQMDPTMARQIANEKVSGELTTASA